MTQKPPTAQCNISTGNGGGVSESGRWLGYCSSAFALVSLHQGGLPIRANTYDTLDSPAWTMAGDNRPLPAAQSMTYCPRVDVCLSTHTHTRTRNTHARTLSFFLSLPLICQRVKCQLSVSCAEIFKQHTHNHTKGFLFSFFIPIFQTINSNFQLEKTYCPWWHKKLLQKSLMHNEVINIYLIYQLSVFIYLANPKGGVWVVWGHLNHGDYRHYGNRYLLRTVIGRRLAWTCSQ